MNKTINKLNTLRDALAESYRLFTESKIPFDDNAKVLVNSLYDRMRLSVDDILISAYNERNERQ